MQDHGMETKAALFMEHGLNEPEAFAFARIYSLEAIRYACDKAEQQRDKYHETKGFDPAVYLTSIFACDLHREDVLSAIIWVNKLADRRRAACLGFIENEIPQRCSDPPSSIGWIFEQTCAIVELWRLHQSEAIMTDKGSRTLGQINGIEKMLAEDTEAQKVELPMELFSDAPLTSNE